MDEEVVEEVQFTLIIMVISEQSFFAPPMIIGVRLKFYSIIKIIAAARRFRSHLLYFEEGEEISIYSISIVKEMIER